MLGGKVLEGFRGEAYMTVPCLGHEKLARPMANLLRVEAMKKLVLLQQAQELYGQKHDGPLARAIGGSDRGERFDS